uniref:Bacteriophage/plasmid primase P4 C-terminal domain-containing protein n=1 Tax=Physcomitrium patens TaxID=3218 RepID=A0A7I4B300_PHYPA
METIEPATKIIDFIQSSDNRKKMMYTCAGMLYKEGFEELLDSKRDVIGMKSGVYNFTEDRFRMMELDDYITLSTRISFVPLDYNSEATNEVLDLLAKIQSHGKLEDTKYYNKKELSINMLRQIYNCTYLKHKVRWFSIKANEEFDILEDSIKIL